MLSARQPPLFGSRVPGAEVAPFARILVGYDGSFEAQAALRLAIELARGDHRVQVTAVAVARLPTAPATLAEAREEHAIAGNLARRWLAAATAYAGDYGCRIDTTVVPGRVAPALIRAAVEHRADLLVIGTVHRRLAWLRRSTTAAVVRRAPCPVLITHQ